VRAVGGGFVASTLANAPQRGLAEVASWRPAPRGSRLSRWLWGTITIMVMVRAVGSWMRQPSAGSWGVWLPSWSRRRW
jgi:hypothetical protein